MNGDGTARDDEAAPWDSPVALKPPPAESQSAREALGRRQQHKSRTRERLLKVASGLFVSQGFEETTYDDIARAAHVARQTVFNYYPRKEDFVIAWATHRREEVRQALATNALAGEDAAARLVLIMQVLADAYERSPAAGRVYAIAWVKSGGPILEEPFLAAQFAAIIADGQRSGEIGADIDADTAGQLIRAAYFDALWRWVGRDRREDTPSLFSGLLGRLELMLTGLWNVPGREGPKQSIRLARAIEDTRRRNGGSAAH